MALVIEDGTGKSDANAYVSVADLDAYLTLRGKSISGGDSVKEAAIVKATDYMVQKYRANWKGYKKTQNQALDWPRELVYLDSVYSDDYVLNTIVPVEVKNACCELAYRSVSDDLMPDLSQGVKREKVDVIEVEYDNNSPQSPRYNAVDGMLKPYLRSTGSSVRLQRV